MRRKLTFTLAAVVLLIGAVWTYNWAATLPSVELVPFASDFEGPVAMVEHDGRYYVAERRGTVRVIGDNEPVLTVEVALDSSEQGLLGLVVTDDEVIVHYTRYGDGATVIESFPDNRVLLTVEQPGALHNGGQLAFGPDGALYVGLGDGGDVGLSFGRGQSTDDLLGSIVRIDEEPVVWAIGLRNPWTFSFDPATGHAWIADVGYNHAEEINVATGPGHNFGWAIYEGSACQEHVDDPCDPDGLTFPIHEYRRNSGECAAVVGGPVMRSGPFAGLYFFADYCTGKIWVLNADEPDRAQLTLDSDLSISAFATDSAGELYVLSYQDGVIYRVEAR